MGRINIGLIGTGFMGKCHALAYNAVKAVFPDAPDVNLEVLCDVDESTVKEKCAQFGFGRWTTNWQELVSDKSVDVVSITAPNGLHKEIALEAIANGKSVYCEKPLALTYEDAVELASAAKSNNTPTLVGYNYIKNPALIHAKKLIENDVIGRVIQFRGTCDEDYMANEDLPYTWRCRIKDAGTGTLGDLAVHLVSIAHYLVGEIAQVTADIETVHKNRPDPKNPGSYGKVENEDQANALVRFKNGVQGVLCSSRSVWGRKNYLSFEVHGSKGTILFNQERMNELQLYEVKDDNSVAGFKTILTAPPHEPYGLFVPAPGHGLGFNDLKTIEVAHLLDGLSGKEKLYPSFEDALKIENVIHSIVASSNNNNQTILI